jgi:hypothetical protein
MKTIQILIISFLISLIAPAQTFNEIAGRPTCNSVTLSLLFDQHVEFSIHYGNSSGNYPSFTPLTNAEKDVPVVTELTGLAPGARCYYQTWYRLSGSAGNFLKGPERSLTTCRNPGTSFSFAIEADPHLDTNSNPEAYALTLQNIAAAHPDFLIDMGDIFMSEKLAVKTQENITARVAMYRPLLGEVCHSAPLYLVIGNHEGEQGWKNDGSDTCLPVRAVMTRKKYYANPEPGTFYSGNSHPDQHAGLLQDYYAWEWGNALFVVLDPYWYTITKPGWGWTLGHDQYQWFKQTITGSHAKFKFVFCHQLVGGNGNDARGGAEYASLWEMGGMNSDATWGFDQNRPGWEKPIHQLMDENGGTIFFHGHDHFYGKQQKDGIVYQELPQPSSRSVTTLQATQYGYLTGEFLPSRGYVLVTVTDTTAKVDYIRTYLPKEETGGHANGEVAATYTIKKTASGVTAAGDPASCLIEQVVPNPFPATATIRFSIGEVSRVRLEIFDLAGKSVAVLVDETRKPGSYTVDFPANKILLSPGIYLCRLQSGLFQQTIKMIFMP